MYMDGRFNPMVMEGKVRQNMRDFAANHYEHPSTSDILWYRQRRTVAADAWVSWYMRRLMQKALMLRLEPHDDACADAIILDQCCNSSRLPELLHPFKIPEKILNATTTTTTYEPSSSLPSIPPSAFRVGEQHVSVFPEAPGRLPFTYWTSPFPLDQYKRGIEWELHQLLFTAPHIPVNSQSVRDSDWTAFFTDPAMAISAHMMIHSDPSFRRAFNELEDHFHIFRVAMAGANAIVMFRHWYTWNRDHYRPVALQDKAWFEERRQKRDHVMRTSTPATEEMWLDPPFGHPITTGTVDLAGFRHRYRTDKAYAAWVNQDWKEDVWVFRKARSSLSSSSTSDIELSSDEKRSLFAASTQDNPLLRDHLSSTPIANMDASFWRRRRELSDYMLLFDPYCLSVPDVLKEYFTPEHRQEAMQREQTDETHKSNAFSDHYYTGRKLVDRYERKRRIQQEAKLEWVRENMEKLEKLDMRETNLRTKYLAAVRGQQTRQMTQLGIALADSFQRQFPQFWDDLFGHPDNYSYYGSSSSSGKTTGRGGGAKARVQQQQQQQQQRAYSKYLTRCSYMASYILHHLLPAYPIVVVDSNDYYYCVHGRGRRSDPTTPLPGRLCTLPGCLSFNAICGGKFKFKNNGCCGTPCVNARSGLPIVGKIHCPHHFPGHQPRIPTAHPTSGKPRDMVGEYLTGMPDGDLFTEVPCSASVHYSIITVPPPTSSTAEKKKKQKSTGNSILAHMHQVHTSSSSSSSSSCEICWENDVFVLLPHVQLQQQQQQNGPRASLDVTIQMVFGGGLGGEEKEKDAAAAAPTTTTTTPPAVVSRIQPCQAHPTGFYQKCATCHEALNAAKQSCTEHGAFVTSKKRANLCRMCNPWLP